MNLKKFIHQLTTKLWYNLYSMICIRKRHYFFSFDSWISGSTKSVFFMSVFGWIQLEIAQNLVFCMYILCFVCVKSKKKGNKLLGKLQISMIVDF